MQVLLVEDDVSLRKSLVQVFESEGISVLEAGSFIVAKDIILANFDGVVLSDIRMDGKDGFDVLALCNEHDPDLPVIIMTGHAEIQLAVRALKAGAYDFLEKPCHPDLLLNAIRTAHEHRLLTVKARHLEQKVRQSDSAARDFPGQSRAISKFRDDLRRLSPLPVHLHFWGEAGVGKRLAARCVTAMRDFKHDVQTVDLRHVSSDELSTVLKGSPLKQLTIQNVDEGTSRAQRILVGFLDNNSTVRIITTATAPLSDLSHGVLSKELYHRFNFAELEIPPLRHRVEDILEVFQALLREQSIALDMAIPNLSDAVLAETCARPWRGNLSELRQWAQQVLLELYDQDQAHSELSLTRRMAAFEKSVLLDSLIRHKGVTAKVAEELRLPLKTLYDRLARYELKSSAYRAS